ncbi:MAG: c-type cytochrome, partial [Xanthobacteraceae bacterium]
MMFRTVLAISAIAIGVTAAIAQQDPVKARKDLMESNAKQFYGVLGRMQRGQIPYEQAKVDAALGAIAADTARYAPAFATNAMPATQSDYDASPKIWQNKADFDAKVASYVKVVNENQKAAKDIETLKVVFKNVGTACDACHENYRV